MVLIDVHTPKTFEEYIKSLSKRGKRIWRLVKSRCKDIEYKKVPYNREEMARFMDLWEHQLIRGEYRHWAFGIDYIDKLEMIGVLECFAAFKNGEKIALHFVENHNGYVECHPVMYDKTKYSSIGLSKFMWMNLVKYAIESPTMKWLDLGGGRDDNWQEAIKERKQHPTCFYKWGYVAKEVKECPDKQPKLRLCLPQGKLGDIKYLEEIK